MLTFITFYIWLAMVVVVAVVNLAARLAPSPKSTSTSTYLNKPQHNSIFTGISMGMALG